MPEIDLNELRRWQRDLGRQSAERTKLTRAIGDGGAQLRALDLEIARLTAAGAANAAGERRAVREQVAAARNGNLARLRELDGAIRAAIDRIGPRLDPADADPALPLLLFPVRVETRFAPDGSALRVRIFPDDAHIDALDRGVSDQEREAGMAYWNAVWRASDEEAGTAWRTLLASAGKLRARWVALALRPTNLDRRNDDAAPAFGDVAPRTRRAAVARLLPDAFTAVAIQGESRSTATGRSILPEVPVGLFADDGSELREVNGVKVVAGAEWLVDYAEAERVGLAVTVPLRRRGAKVDQLFVFGVRRSLDPKNTAVELAALLEAQQCTQGLAFVPQGTPTNNTETDRAGWQRRIEPKAPARAAGPAPDPRSNAAVLAAALGLDARALGEIEHSDELEQARASAMNIALWNPSWGGFLEKVNRVTKDGATLSDRAREDTRRFHRDFVRGRGPLPALRIGSQPYGIVPVSSFTRWKSDRGDTFEAGLLPLLQRLRDRWRQCLDKVPRIGVGPIDDTLRELLGSSAVALALRVRTVLSEEIAQLAPNITDAATTDLEVERMIDEVMFEEVIANASLVRRTGSLGESRPLSLPLVDDGDPAFLEALLAGGSPKIESVFQALVALAWDRARRDVDKDSAGGRFAEVIRNATGLSAIDREKTLAIASRAESTDAATLFTEASRLGTLMRSAPPTHVEYQPIAATSRSFGELSLQSTSEAARAELGLFGAYAWLNSRGRFNELRTALEELKSTALDERRILLAETIDLASHRLDAWMTALVERRRHALRAAQPEGLTIGAYGWVEDIEPTGNRQLDGGFVHAPSLTHAATAGVLRSAYLSHNADGSGQGAFAIDLTSARVRAALHLVEGIRQGQPLAGLIGYQIERRIHEVELDRLILSLRTIAPFSQGKLTDRTDAVPAPAVESLAAANVVDGLDLVEKYQGKVKLWDATRIRNELSATPKNNPYLTQPWPKLTDAEWAQVTGIFDEAATALDAVGDLLLAESVHQLVSGNTARAAAALDAASSGDSPPPEPEVIATPAEGMPFTHRVMLVAGNAAPWNLTRPRSAAEPRLEAWAAARLGQPDTIVVATNADDTLVTVADSGRCALDLIYDATDRATFDERLRAALPSLAANAKFHHTRVPAWAPAQRSIGDVFECAASLRTLLVNARPALPTDFAIPNVPATRAFGVAALTEARARAQAARDLLGLRCAMLDAALTVVPPDPVQVRTALEALAEFGFVTPKVSDHQVIAIAQASLATGKRRVQNADAALALPLSSETVVQAGQAIFGDGFWILPAVDPPPVPDAWNAALAAPPPGVTVTAIRTYLTDVASVRAGVRRLLEAELLVEAVGAAPPPRVAQFVGLGGTAPSRWIGAALPLDEPTPTAPVVSTVLDVAGEYDPAGATVALIVDEWIDVVPVRARRGKGENAPIDERVTTAATFNAMAPSARAPQAMLLAVTPDRSRWTAETLLDTLVETLELAKLRAVTLERTNGIARILPALYEQSWSLQGEKVLDLHLVVQEAASRNFAAAYVREAKS